MFLTIDEAAVRADDWAAIIQGDESARARVRAQLDNVVLYEHNLSVLWEKGWRPIPLRELERYGIILSVKMQTEIRD